MTVTIVQAKLNLKDPHDCTDASDDLTLFQAFFDTLVKRQGQSFIPHLAHRWDVTPDAQTWVFHLRENIQFHDGAFCDAAAVITSLQRLARADKGYTLGAPGVWNQFLGDAQMSADDELTVRISLSSPIADLLDILVQCFIVAPSSIEALEQGNTHSPVGSGPYRAVTVTTSEIVAERTEVHFAGRPLNAQIRWVCEPDQTIRQSLLMEGVAQVASDLDFETSSSLGDADHTRVEYLSPVAVIYLLNATKSPLNDQRIRRALNISIDREDIIQRVMKGAAQPLLGFVSPSHFGSGKGADLTQDRALARSLIREAGYENSLTIEADCPRRLPDESVHLTEVVSEQLQQIGVELKVHYHEDREAYAHMVRRKEIRDLCVFDSSPLSTFRVLYEKLDARIKGSWWQGYHNGKVEGYLDQARSTTNASARAKFYGAAYRELQRDPPWLTLYNPLRIVGIAGKHPEFKMPVDGVIDVTALPDLEVLN